MCRAGSKLRLVQWKQSKQCGGLRWITSLMKVESWRGHKSYLLYSTSGLSLQPKPSRSTANTRCCLAS